MGGHQNSYFRIAKVGNPSTFFMIPNWTNKADNKYLNPDFAEGEATISVLFKWLN